MHVVSPQDRCVTALLASCSVSLHVVLRWLVFIVDYIYSLMCVDLVFILDDF